jgi:hypothetical protein
MTNLSSITPINITPINIAPTDTAPADLSKIADTPEPGGRTMRAESESENSSVLTFLCPDGRPLSVSNGGELGRGGECCEALHGMQTVSRRHARVSRSGGRWQIEDVGSTNGTWVNDRRLERGRPHPIEPGDRVNLSLSCELKVIA